jgi:phosphate transport system permease protein
LTRPPHCRSRYYNWTQRGDPAFIERASAARSLSCWSFLLIMNAIAILLRRRFERRW